MDIVSNTRIFNEIFEKDSEGNIKITRTSLLNAFSRNYKTKKVKLRTDDQIKIGPDVAKYVKPGSITTVGTFVVNKLMLEPLGIFGYHNDVINGATFREIYENLATALAEGEITTEQGFVFIDNTEFLLGGPLSHIINPSITDNMLSLDPEVAKLRTVLFKKFADELAEGDSIVAARIEKELCDLAWKKLVDSKDPCIDIYNSKCGIDFYNNYKNLFIMKGPVLDNLDPSGRKYNIITSNLNEGISKNDFMYMADTAVLEAYSVGKATGVAGYYTKKYNNLFSHIKLDKTDSDCGTTGTIDVTITSKNKSYWGKYHYFVDRGKLQLITPKTVDSYIGKTLKMRTPLRCKAKDGMYCSKCYGKLSYIQNKPNVGQTYAVIPNTMMNANLKKKHDITIKLGKIDTDLLTKALN